MRILSPWFVQAWAGRLLNIHPSLLPLFPGVDTHNRVLAAGHERHGCTVHWVIEALDAGPTLGQAEVPVLPGDTEASLAERVLAEEHRLYVRCLAQAARTIQAERTAQAAR
jgi:folate-dependent phosphoribosylglycinamide formyltransferase PurN